MKTTKSKLPFFAVVASLMLFGQIASAQEALFPFAEKGKYGYINKTGKVIIAPTYEYADAFSEGLAMVKTDAKRGYIDATGKLVIPAIYDMNPDGGFSDGWAVVKQGSKFSYIDKTGKAVLDPKVSKLHVFGLWGQSSSCCSCFGSSAVSVYVNVDFSEHHEIHQQLFDVQCLSQTSADCIGL